MKSSSSILVFATQHMQTGGIESHLQEFCFHMAETGLKIDLVVTNSFMLPETEVFFRKVCRKVYLGQQALFFEKMLWMVAVGIKLISRKYKALYTNGQGESVLMFKKLIPFHQQWVHHHHTSGDDTDQKSWGKEYCLTLKQANKVVACSSKIAKEIGTATGRKIEYVPCFSKQIMLQDSLNRAAEKIKLGYFGRLIPEKGIDLICRLSNETELKEVEFHIWGEGAQYPAVFFEKFRNLKFHGMFNGREELLQVVQSFDGFLLLSTHNEGLPICLLEIMSAGIPWLATNKGGIPDIVSDPVSTRLISATSTYNEIKMAVLSFANDIENGEVSKKSQIDMYSNKFSPAKLVEQWEEILGV
ncbi:MAG: glycosyl transferase group 1 [Daejeonella sp.]|nr:glycosyl transferase group 1 [Daejeonella sp.]